MAFFDELYGESTKDEIETGAAEETGFFLERKPYHSPKDGRNYWLYFVKANFRGSKVDINFTCSKKDPVSYEQIAYIFKVENATSIPIYMKESSFEDSKGNSVKTTKYFVKFSDDDDELGGALEIGLKPKNESDKTFWTYFMTRLKKQKELEDEAKAAQETAQSTEPAQPENNKKGKSPD